MIRRLALPVALVFGAAGCTAIPNVGPSADDVVQQQAASDGSDLLQRFEVVDIDSAVVDVLRRRAPDSFRTSFGDYRPSLEPRIGVGDFVNVTIWEAGAGGLFSAPLATDRFTTGSKSATIPDQVVGRDGSITVPYAGRVRVIGRTTAEVQSDIERALEGKAIQPQALVNVSKPISNTVAVTGEVIAGSRVPLSVKGDRLMDVIATAGGVRAPVNETFVQLSRGGRTARVALSRVVTDPRENIFMRPDDVLTLIRDPQVFIAYGATGRNAEVPFEAEGVMLSQALAKAGGLLDYRADPSGVFIFRYEPESVARVLRPGSALVKPGRLTPIVYRLNLRDANSFFVSQNFRIFNKDVLYVSNASLTDLQKALQIFNMIAAPAATGASIGSAFR